MTTVQAERCRVIRQSPGICYVTVSDIVDSSILDAGHDNHAIFVCSRLRAHIPSGGAGGSAACQYSIGGIDCLVAVILIRITLTSAGSKCRVIHRDGAAQHQCSVVGNDAFQIGGRRAKVQRGSRSNRDSSRGEFARTQGKRFFGIYYC